MSTRMIVDPQSHLEEIRESEFPPQPAGIKIFAKIISYVFHPVFLPVYVMAFLLFVQPYLFAGYSFKNKILVLLQSFMMMTFFPLITVLLLKALNFIRSIHLHTQKDRIIPFIACMTWYFWLWYVWKNMGKSNDAVDMPVETVRLALAMFLSTIIGLMLNIKMKVSLHAIAGGVMCCFLVLLALSGLINPGIYLSVGLFITGLICTSRFIASDHSSIEVYAGLLAGIVSMLVAWWV